MAGNQLRVMLIRIIKICSEKVKLTFSEKVSKIDKIFTVNLTVDSNCQMKISSIFVAFLEYMNFTLLTWKHLFGVW